MGDSSLTGSATGLRSPVSALKGRRPSPLDDGAMSPSLRVANGEGYPGSYLRSLHPESETDCSKERMGIETPILSPSVSVPDSNGSLVPLEIDRSEKRCCVEGCTEPALHALGAKKTYGLYCTPHAIEEARERAKASWEAIKANQERAR